MKKLISRRILSVLLFCIVSTSVFGSAENAVRNDSLLLLCKSGTSTLRPFDRLSQRSAEVSSSLTNNSTNGITSAYIALATVSVVLFFLNSSSLFLFVALLAFLLCNYIPECDFNSVRKKVNSLKITLRGRFAVSFISPGRCPGLGCVALSGRGLRSFVFLFHYLNPISLHRSILAPSLVGRVGVGLSSFPPRGNKKGAFLYKYFAPKGAFAIITILTLFFAFAGKEAAANSAENTRLTPSNEKRQLAVKYTEETSSPVFTQLASTVLQAAATITSTATGGDWSKPATWKNGIVPGAGDDVIISNGSTVTIDMDTPALGSLTIGQGTSGILQYDAIAERTVTVSGIVTINSGGTFRSAPPTTAGTIKDNLLVVGVSLINNGTIDFCSQSSGAGIKFIGTTTGNSMFNCESSAKTNLQDTNGVTLEMDNPGKTLLFYPGTDFKVCSTTTKGFLTIVSGIFKLASGAIPFSNPVFSSTSYTIPAAGGFELSNANATITGQNGTVTNQGKIIVSAGTYNIGTATGNSSLTSNDGTFAQSGGTINIAGRFKISGGNCNISGGTMNIATIGYADAREAAFHIAKEANLNMVGSPLITFTYPHSNTVPFSDIYIESGKLKSIAGGTFQMGTSATPELSTFFVNSEIPLDRITVFNECAIRVVNTSQSRIANTVNGTFDKVVMPLSPPESITVICNGTIPAACTNLQAFTDAGGKALHNCTLLPASFKFVGQTQSGTSCPYTITRTYQVTDIFGSTGTTQHLIFVEDEATEPPPEAVVEPAKEEEEEELKLKSAMVNYTAISGNWSDPATWGGTVPTALDDVTIPNGVTVTIDAASVCNDITIQAGGTINSGGAFTLQVNSDWTNNGTYNGGTNGIVEFAGASNANISGTTNFEELIINKGSLSTTLTIDGTANVLSSGKLTLTSGLVTIPVGGSFTVNPASAIAIPAIAGFDVNGGTLTTGNFTITNKGLIRVSSGTANFGTNSGNSVHTQFDGAFIVSGGNVNIAGRLENSASGTLTPPGVTSGINISGGTVTLSTVGNGLSNVGTLDVTSAGTFNFTGGTLVFQNKSTATTALDLGLIGGTGAKTTIGGTFQFGNASTPVGTVFNISSNVPLNSVTSSANADIKLADDVTIGQLALNPGTTIDLNGNTLQISVSSTGTYNFPLDNGSGVSIPVTVNLTSGTFASGAYIQIETNASKHPNNASSTNYLNRYWTVTTSGITTPVYDVTATYADADVPLTATETEIAMGSWTGAKPWVKYADVNAGTNTVSKTGITSTSFVFAGITSDPPTVTASASPAAICLGSSANLTATPLGDEPFSYSWSPSAGLSATDISNPVANPTATTTYTVTITDGNGFTDDDQITVTVNPTPTATAPANQTYCNGVVTTTITLAGTPSGVVFDISGGAAIGLVNQTGVTAIPVFTPVAGAATVSITPRANDCTGNQTNFTITVNPTPTLSGASQADAVCAGSAATINLTGLLANSTSTIAYTINGAAQTPVTGIAANGLGAASFNTVNLTAANNGQTLQITGITTTSLTPNCNQSFTQNVTLDVNSAPVITSCPSPTIALNTSAGVCTAVGTYSVEASGQPVPTFTYTFTGATTGTGAGTGTGSTFNAGTTNVTVTATNSCGNVACNFSVTVTDNVLPVITNCPTNITVYTGIGSTTCEQTATWTAPAATDNCTATGSLVWTNTHSPGATFPVGTTIVTYTVKDASNNTATCTFNVIVIDNTKPIFNAPGEAFVNVDASCNVSVLPTFTGNVTGLFDNCTIPANLVVTYIDGVSSPAGAGCAYPYSFTRTWRVTDAAGNFEEKTQLITVRDLIKPVISVPANIARRCEQSILPAETGTATAIDNCPGTVTIAYTDATAAGSCAGNSVITRTWSATDCSGNISTGVQLITVSDGINPTATAPPDPIATCPSTIPFAYADYTEFVSAGGTASDNCGPVTVVLYDEIANGLEGKPGYCPISLTRTYRVTDQCGNYTDVVQTVNIAGECGCSPCTTGTNFHWVDMLNDPTGTILLEDQIRNGKCCDAKSNEDCISFNVRIDDDAVGVEILIEGAAPSPQDWRIDCTGINMSDGIVCIPGGAFHLFTFCKPGQNANDFTFRSIPGVIAASDINARVDCSGQLEVTGIASNPVWTSISPGVEGEYNSYLSSTTILNPIFTAPAGAPPVIQYQICGNIGSTVCNSLGTDCDVISVYVKEEIELHWNIDPTLVCANNIPTFVAEISPAGATYTYEWYSGYGATGTLLHSGSNSYKPLVAGPYSLRVTDTQNGIPCSIQIFDFDVIFDTTGAAVFSPPNDLTIECNASNASTLIQNWLASAVAEDEDGNPLPVTTDYNGITMACGTDLLVTFSASDHCGNIGTATKHIFVIDTQVPTWLTAAGYLNRTLSCSDAAGIATAQALAPVATDVCDSTLTLTKTTGAFVAGTCPNAGTYTNTWTATDDCNNVSAVFTQTITITDTTPPAITTPAANQTVECDGSGNTVALNAWLANYGGAVANDACGGTITWTNSSPVFSDLCGATGSATVTFTASDVCGNQSTTQAIFTISDTQEPSITCPATASGTTDNNECFSTTVVLGTPVVSDVCGGAINVTNNAPVQYPVGNTIVTWTATDACGNSNTCNQTVTVTDNNQPPTIACPANVVQTADPGNCFLNNVVIPNPAIADNCGVTKLTWTMTGVTAGTSPATGVNYVGGETFNVGITTVTYIAYDAAGNASQPCSFDVWIKDLVKPVLTAECPADVTTTVDPGICTAAVTVLAPAITDPCNETFTVVNSFNGTGNASGNYPVGTTSVVWTITDFSGNITTCTQTVTVSDNQNPVFVSCPANQEEQIINGGCNKTGITITEPTFSDNCGIDRLTWTMSGATTGSSPATGINYVTSQIFNIGITTVTYTLVDANNLSVTCTFTVWMKNLISPQFAATCPGDVSAVATNLRCDAVVNVPPPTISNPCNELYTVTNNSPFKTSDTDASGTYPVGSTSFTWTVTDASGNVKLCPQTVTVTDTQAPVFTLCPANQSEEIINGGCDKTSITLINPTFTDNCGIDRLTWTMSGATTRSSAVTGLNYVNGEIFNIGITLVTYTVTDVNGLSETCSFTVWMKNLISPQFAATCPGDVSVPADAGLCNANVTVPAPAITNPCNEAYTMVNDFNGTNNASGIYPIGTTTVHWTITDASGNVITCTQTVTVNDLPLVCPDPIIRPADFGQTYATNVIVPPPGFSNNCTGLTLIWSMILPDASTLASPLSGINIVPSPGTFNVGVTTVTYTLTHATSVTESCSFTVTITAKPDITCLTDITHTADPGECNYTVNPGTPTLVEGAQPITWTYTIGGGTPVTFVGSVANPGPPAIGLYDFPVGTTTINWTATNDSGTDACTQTITVNDVEDPTFTLPPAMSECVESLSLATYDPATTDITPARPDYFIFVNGSTALNLTGLADNCCAIGDLLISWTINFSGGGSLSGTGQPSLHGSDIQLPGDMSPYDNDLIHTIIYTVTDCNGNPAAEQTQNITIKPRPNVVKMP